MFLDVSEFALLQIEQEFQRLFPKIKYFVWWVMKDADFLDRVFSSYQPSVVFRVAAYKHVPLMEGENAWQGGTEQCPGIKMRGRGFANDTALIKWC